MKRNPTFNELLKQQVHRWNEIARGTHHMSKQRKYSVDEIESMRRSIYSMIGWRYAKAEAVELRLRTHMLNGSDPKELQRHARAAAERKYDAVQAEAARHPKTSRPTP